MSKLTKVCICSDPEHYSKAYHAFENLSAKYEEFTNWSQRFFPSAVVDKLHPGLSTLRMLGIGSGAGEAESEMLLQLLKKFHRIENTVVEPSEERILEYKTSVSNDDKLLKFVDFKWENQTIGEYQRMTRTREQEPERFHFISALHCLYHVKDPSDTIKFMYDSLESGGIMMVVLSTGDSGFGELWSRFPVLAMGNNYFHLHSGHVKSTLDWMNVPHYSFHGRAFLDITSCYHDQSTQSDLALDFITSIVNFREWATPTLEEEVLDFLKTSNCSKISSDGKIMFHDKWEAVLAIKT
ncbi:putative histamine N-methyltransferase A [Apostichopus japonicus]|uniref:Putative histamine N-methyltransferase A n=1 Tax=Stichopus japonicus TaxID=307972 RepID=A0A2G8LM23_STIJA|nr:putative histamine N-methyltransferase A [Apostichopus japonicus]